MSVTNDEIKLEMEYPEIKSSGKSDENLITINVPGVDLKMFEFIKKEKKHQMEFTWPAVEIKGSG